MLTVRINTNLTADELARRVFQALFDSHREEEAVEFAASVTTRDPASVQEAARKVVDDLVFEVEDAA